MPYLYNTPEDQTAMLAAIGAGSIDDLFAMVPPEMRLERPLAHSARDDRDRTHAAHDRAGGEERARRLQSLLPRRRQLRPLHSGRRRRARRPRRVLHVLHALPGRSQPGQPAGRLRVPIADHTPHRPRCLERQPLRRRQRRGRSRADGRQQHEALRQSRHRRERASRVSPNDRHVSGKPRRRSW